jgi:hypothetical protein
MVMQLCLHGSGNELERSEHAQKESSLFAQFKQCHYLLAYLDFLTSFQTDHDDFRLPFPMKLITVCM